MGGSLSATPDEGQVELRERKMLCTTVLHCFTLMPFAFDPLKSVLGAMS